MILKKNLTYLGYKLLNLLTIKRHKKQFYGDIVFCKERIEVKKSGRILFDFSDSFTHLGDRLFFAPLIFELVRSGFQIYLSKEDSVTQLLFSDLNNSVNLCEYDDSLIMDLVVVNSQSLTALSSKYEKDKLLICEFTSIQNQNILTELSSAFSEITGLNLQCSPIKYIPKNLKSPWLDSDGQYFLFSNYIDSGWFRLFFVRRAALIEKAKKLSADGYKIVHVGAALDVKNDNNNYDFIDMDLRGKLTISNLIDLINCKQIVGAVTYDNFIMHLIGIFDKKAYVLFRGRFIKKNADMHYKFINQVFFHVDNKIHYLS
jgi:hypothetical protein